MDMDADDPLLTEVRVRATDPSLRTDVKVLPPPPLPPPALPERIAAMEALLGRPLHPLLRRVYAEIADGGFGPGHGLSSLASATEGWGAEAWPAWLLPLWDWGCAMWSCLDVTSSEGTIVTHDGADGATVTDFTLRSWLRAWANGVDLWKEIYDDTGREIPTVNPFTREPMRIKEPARARGRKIGGSSPGPVSR